MTIHTIDHYLTLASKIDQIAFLKKSGTPVFALVNETVEQTDAFGTVDNGSLTGIPRISKRQLLGRSTRIYPVAKRHGANHFSRMVMIGRADNCDILIPNSRVSKCHAIVHMKYDSTAVSKFSSEHEVDTSIVSYSITDGGSTNGTFLNGDEVTAGQSLPLNSGDQLSLGPTVSMLFYHAADFYTMLSRVLAKP